MGNYVKDELSKKNKYYLPKNRFLELKYFCLQYPDWKEAYQYYNEGIVPRTARIELFFRKTTQNDQTSDMAILLNEYMENIKLIDEVAEETEPELKFWLIKGITGGLPYYQLKTAYEIPCGKDMYYDRYRKFFWLLDKRRK